MPPTKLEPVSPALNDSHRKKLNMAMAALQDLQNEIERAKNSGMDVAEEELRCAHAIERCKLFKAAYWPTLP